MRKAELEKLKTFVGQISYSLESLIGKIVNIHIFDPVNKVAERVEGLLLRSNLVFIEEEEYGYQHYYNLELFMTNDEYPVIPENNKERELALDDIRPNAFVPYDPSKDYIYMKIPKPKDSDEDRKKELRIDVYILDKKEVETVGSCYHCKNFEICKQVVTIKGGIGMWTANDFEKQRHRVYIAMAIDCVYFIRSGTSEKIKIKKE